MECVLELKGWPKGFRKCDILESRWSRYESCHEVETVILVTG